MGGRIPDNFIDELLGRVDIVDVIERRVPLRKAGHEWTACCPFHDERTPSFTVSPQKQFYHCFGCGVHGSAIKFLMEYERLEFQDAVEELAQSVGLTVVYEGRRSDAPREDRSDLYDLLEAATRYYQDELSRSAEARQYSNQRGLDGDTLKAFRIGWAPAGWDGLMRRLGNTPERLKWLDQAGMISRGDGDKKYDRFRERLMFPIQDRRGRVIAFGGRVLKKEGYEPSSPDSDAQEARKGNASPKYLNSPETPLFHKGRELFALWQVKQANSKLGRIVVVEGYMDVIALHQAGLPIAVATLGTATTPEHSELLFRAAAEVVFCFDGDRAGRAAAWKALEAALPRLRDGRQAFFLFLPDGEDPDSLIRKEGKDGFEKRLRDATPLSDYLFGELASSIDMRNLDGRARLAEQARPLIARLPDGAFRDLMGQELERRTGASARLTRAPTARAPAHSGAEKLSLVRSAVTLLLAQPSLADMLEPPYAFLKLDKPGISLLAELIDCARARPGISTGALLEHFSERPEYDYLQKLASVTSVGNAEMQRVEFSGALAQIQRQAISQRIGALIGQQGQAGLDAHEKDELRQLLMTKAQPRASS